MVLTSYQDKVAELITELKKDPLATDENMGTAKDMTADEIAQLMCAAFICRNARTEMGYQDTWKDVVTGWFMVALFAGKAYAMSEIEGNNNAFIDTLVELANVYADHHA